MILGISASGRANGVISEAVKAVLENSGLDSEYISLSGKRISGCMGCTKCASNNRCIMKDDWLGIGEKMLKADAIVFGAPNYYNSINAIGHACLERTYCFRHRELFDLAGKLGVIVGAGYKQSNEPVYDFVEKMMISNKMVVVSNVHVDGYSQCYTCGYGHDCSVGGVVGKHGFLDKIEKEHFPPHFNCQESAKLQAYKAGKVLASIINNRK